MFTASRLGLSPSLCRCLCSTNIIESPDNGMRLRTRRICRWRGGRMVLRWDAAAFLIFPKIQGYRDLWRQEATLEGSSSSQEETVRQVA